MREDPLRHPSIKSNKLGTPADPKIAALLKNTVFLAWTLEYLEGVQTYKTTEKGFNLLKMHNEIGELLQTSTRESRIPN